MPLQEREADDAAAGVPDEITADDPAGSPISAFHEDVGSESSDESLGRRSIENDDVIHAGQR